MQSANVLITFPSNVFVSAYLVLDISGFTGGRSIAHMLSPIKPIACEVRLLKKIAWLFRFGA